MAWLGAVIFQRKFAQGLPDSNQGEQFGNVFTLAQTMVKNVKFYMAWLGAVILQHKFAQGSQTEGKGRNLEICKPCPNPC